MTKACEWTDNQVQYLRKHYGKAPNEAIAQELGLTTHMVRYKAVMLGLNRREGCMVHPQPDALAMARWRAEYA